MSNGFVDLADNALDGDWQNGKDVFPSGDGIRSSFGVVQLVSADPKAAPMNRMTAALFGKLFMVDQFPRPFGV